jgi:hypothetical protein
MSTATTERYREVLHKRHGWLAAPDGCYFEVSGKSVWLVEPDRDGTQPWYYPFGTRFNLASIYGFGEEA